MWPSTPHCYPLLPAPSISLGQCPVYTVLFTDKGERKEDHQADNVMPPTLASSPDPTALSGNGYNRDWLSGYLK